jgi:hypothetical protein
MDPHEVIQFAKDWLDGANCGVELPQTLQESLEYQDVFASALFEAIPEESTSSEDPKTVYRNLHSRLQWMAAILTQLAQETERKRDEVAAKHAASHRQSRSVPPS